MEIAAYGLVDSELPPHEKHRILVGRFPKEQPVVVFGPYYKMRMDGSVGVRVEQLKEIIPWRDVPTGLTT